MWALSSVKRENPFFSACIFHFKESPLGIPGAPVWKTEISKLITPRGAVVQRQWIIGINMRKLPRQRGGSNDMPPFTSHQLWVLSINTSICSQLQWTVRKKVVGRLLSWERCTISHGTCAAAPREDWMTFGRLVYACAVLGLTALCCDAWMWAGPVMREYVFVLNCVSVTSSIYLGQ